MLDAEIYDCKVIHATIEDGVKGEKGDKGDQGPPVPVAQELGDDPDLAVSQKLLKDSIDSMEQSNSEAVAEAERLNDLSQQAASSAAESESNASTYAESADSSALSAAQSSSESASSAEQSLQSASSSESSADRAEAARDAAFVNADVYPDVAAGLASVAYGEQFQVLSDEGLEYKRYRKDSATEATEVGEGFPTPKQVEGAVQQAENAADRAETALAGVEQALDLGAADIYIDVASGLAGTVNTENFWVIPNEGDGIENLTLYNNNASEAVKLYELYNLESYMIEEGANWETGE